MRILKLRPLSDICHVMSNDFYLKMMIRGGQVVTDITANLFIPCFGLKEPLTQISWGWGLPWRRTKILKIHQTPKFEKFFLLTQCHFEGQHWKLITFFWGFKVKNSENCSRDFILNISFYSYFNWKVFWMAILLLFSSAKLG